MNESNVEVRVTDTAICLRAPYERSDDCRSIPGGKWKKDWRCWVFPKSPTAASRILEAFGPDADQDGRLAGMVQVIAQAREVKQSNPALSIPGLKTRPWRHQVKAFQYAMKLNAVALAMGMGTGKSLSTVSILINRGRYALIQCPKSVVPVWPLEFKIHSGVDVAVLALEDGSVAQKTKKAEQFMRSCMLRNKRGIVVVNYDSCWREPFASFALKAGFDTAVFDEMHVLKSPSGRRSKFCFSLSKVTRFRIGLTGTPMPHSPLDVFGQYRAIDSSVFGTSWTRFRARYARMGGFGNHQVIGYENLDELYKLFESVTFQAGRDVIELPEETRQVIPVTLGKKSMAILKALENDLYAAWDAGELTASNALVKLLRQAQVCNGHARLDDGTIHRVGDEKAQALAELLDGMPQREPVVVFGRFKEDLDTIKAVSEKQGRRYAELSGRRNDLKEWQAGNFDVIGVQLQAGGVGISLVRARYCIYFALDYSLGVFEQSLCRVHRPGQKQTVHFWFIIAKGTVDEKVVEALQKRKDVVKYVLDGLPARREREPVLG